MRRLFIVTFLIFISTISLAQNDNVIIYNIVFNRTKDSLLQMKDVILLDSTTNYFKHNNGGVGGGKKEIYSQFNTPMEGFNFIVDFYNQNNTRHGICDVYPECMNSTIIKTKEINELFSSHDVEENWNKFYQKFPNSKGFFAVSKIKYNATNDIAVVYIEKHQGNLNGLGLIMLLKRTDKWNFVCESLVWVS